MKGFYISKYERAGNQTFFSITEEFDGTVKDFKTDTDGSGLFIDGRYGDNILYGKWNRMRDNSFKLPLDIIAAINIIQSENLC